MESYEVPNTVSYEDLLKAMSERPLGSNDDQYRSVYIIQLIQRLHILINQDKRRLSR